MKKSEMKPKITYIICPERTYKLFWDMTRACPCDGHCPFEEKQKLLVLCSNCNEMIILDGDYHLWMSIRHGPPTGCFATIFRIGNTYRLLYEVPEP